MKTRIKFFALFLSFIVLLAGCTLTSGNKADLASSTEAAAKQERASAAAKKIKNAGGAVLDAVSVMISADDDNPDEYIVRYGYNRLALSSIKRFRAADLSKSLADSGKIQYQLIITEVAPEKPLYLTISALRSGVESKPTEILEAK